MGTGAANVRSSGFTPLVGNAPSAIGNQIVLASPGPHCLRLAIFLAAKLYVLIVSKQTQVELEEIFCPPMGPSELGVSGLEAVKVLLPIGR